MYISEPEKSIPVVLDLFDEFSDLSGYKINWGKSAMMQLNAQSTLSNLSVNIPIKKQSTYLGIDIQPDVNNIVKSDYEKLFRDIERDLERWTVLPASLMSWIATYWTPYRRYAVKITTSPNCTLCSGNIVGTSMHMVWECPEVQSFWEGITEMLSDIIGKKMEWKLDCNFKSCIFES